MADGERARHIGMVAVHHAAKVQHHQIARLQAALRRHGMAHGAVRAGAGDGVERRALAAEPGADVVELGDNLALGHAGVHAAEQFGKGAVGQLLRAAQALDLVGGLDHAQRRKRAGERHELRRELYKAPVLRNGHPVRLKAAAAAAVAREHGGKRLGQMRRIALDDLIALRLLPRLNGIPEVRKQAAGTPGDEHRGVLAGKAGEIADAGRAVDQRGVQPVLREQRAQPFDPALHDAATSITGSLYHTWAPYNKPRPIICGRADPWPRTAARR